MTWFTLLQYVDSSLSCSFLSMSPQVPSALFSWGGSAKHALFPIALQSKQFSTTWSGEVLLPERLPQEDQRAEVTKFSARLVCCCHFPVRLKEPCIWTLCSARCGVGWMEFSCDFPWPPCIFLMKVVSWLSNKKRLGVTGRGCHSLLLSLCLHLFVYELFQCCKILLFHGQWPWEISSHFICCEECDRKLTAYLQIALSHIGSVPSSWPERVAVRKCEDSSILYQSFPFHSAPAARSVFALGITAKRSHLVTAKK